LPGLFKLLSSSSPKCREGGLEALAAISRVEGAIEDLSWSVRKNPDIHKSILRALREPPPHVRLCAATILSNVSGIQCPDGAAAPEEVEVLLTIVKLLGEEEVTKANLYP